MFRQNDIDETVPPNLTAEDPVLAAGFAMFSNEELQRRRER